MSTDFKDKYLVTSCLPEKVKAVHEPSGRSENHFLARVLILILVTPI